MILAVLNKSRRKPVAGDVFRMRLGDGRFVYGRVLHTEVQVVAGFPGVLIHLYDALNTTGEPPLAEMTLDRLLIPPQVVNHQPWLRGYFETVGSELLSARILPERLCFYSRPRDVYLDANGVEVSRIEPCGFWAVGNHLTTAAEIALVLGILDEAAPPDVRNDLAVLVYDESDGAALNVSIPVARFSDVGELEDAVSRAIQSVGGSVSGHEYGPNSVKLYVRGPRAEMETAISNLGRECR